MEKYDVLIEIYQGVIQGVEILSHEAAAAKWAKWGKKHHYADYEDFLKALNEGMPDEELRWYPEIAVYNVVTTEV